MKQIWISRMEVARRLGVSGPMVSRYCKRGLEALAGEGKRLPWPESRAWVQANIVPERSGSFQSRQRAKAGADKAKTSRRIDAESMTEAQRRKESATADLRELELKKAKGELLPLEDIRREWSGLVSSCRNRLLMVAAKVAPRVASCTDVRQCQVLIESQIREALSALAAE